MKNYLILSALLAFVPATAQTSLGDYRQAVTEYSWELKVAASKSDAASQTMGQARTGYLPRLSLDGSFTATVHHYDGVERWNFSVLPQLVQTVYGGGAVRAAYKQAELGYDIALCDEEFTQLDVRYAAEYTYWNLSAMELYAASMRQYVNIIRSLKEVVDRRFAEGYIAKGDVLMIDARLSEAQYGLVSAEQNYTVALHNFNILRGTDPDLAVELAQGIRDSLPQPVRVLPDEVLGRRPDYMAARLRSEQADAGIRAARAPFNPQVSVGIGGTFDYAAMLAKKATLREALHSKDPRYAALEEELLQEANALGIGPQGLGGDTSVFRINIEHYPTHIAGLPCAVNISCHVTRHAKEVL